MLFDQHRLRRLEHRGRPAHVDVGLCQFARAEELVDRFEYRPVRERLDGEVGELQAADLLGAKRGAGGEEHAHWAAAARRLELAQERQHWPDPRPRGDHQDRARVLPDAERAIGAGEADLIARLQLAVELSGEAPARVALDDQFDSPGICVRHRERALGTIDVDIHELAGREGEARRVKDDAADVVRERLDRGHGRHAVPDRVLEPVVVGVVVEELDHQILLGHRPAHERVAARLLRIGQREVRVGLQRHLALDQEALARRALPLAAAVGQVVALAKGRVEDALVRGAVDLLADRLETDLHSSGAPVRRSSSASSRGTEPSPAGTEDQSPEGSPSSSAVRILGETIFRSWALMSDSVHRRGPPSPSPDPR